MHRTPWLYHYQGLVFGVLAFALLAPSERMMAQVDTGKLLGTVKDQSGAVIPGAKVTLTHEGTSFVLTITSAADGSYTSTPLKIGKYTVEAEFQGFQRARRAGIEVSIQAQVVVDFALVPGAVTQTIEVTAAAPLLQTTSGSVGEVVRSRVINDLPLNGRNYTFLARLTAGVTVGQEENRGLNNNGWFAANGTRPAQNNLLLDGIDNNSNNVDFLNGASYVVRPPVDAIGEFKLQTNSFGAEFGRAGGAVLNASIKSGSNDIHGSVWEFVRNDKLDAADFFQNAANQPKGKFRQNQFGAAAGGRLRKNKTFWFADYEGTRVRQAKPWLVTVPTLAQRVSGFTDFSDLIPGQSGTKGPDLLDRTVPLGTIFDPATTRQVTQGQVDPVTGLTATGSGFVRDPFPGNIIPADRLDANAIKILNLYPEPTGSGLFNNFGSGPIRSDDINQFDVRIDQNFSEKNQLFARYSFFDENHLKPGPFEGLADGGSFNEGAEKVRAQGAALSYTHVFSSTFINEVRVGFNREYVNRLQPFGDDLTDLPAQYGIAGIPQIKGNGGLPLMFIGNLRQIGANDWLVSERFSSTFQISENLTKVYRNHTFKGGLEIQHISFPWTAPPWSRGRFDFNGPYTSIPDQADNSTGPAQFLLTPTTASVPGGIDYSGGANLVFASNFGSLASNKDYYGAYFQDDWKVTPKLTLNLGIRWDHFSLVGDNYGAQANFIPGPAGSGARYLIPTRRQSDPVSTSFTDLLAQDGISLEYTDAYGSGLGLAQKKNFAPRFGFAYQFTPKFVLRGGYGIYYGGFENRGGYPSLGYNYPFQFAFGFFNPNSREPITYANGQRGTLSRGFLDIPLDPALVDAHGLQLRGIEFKYNTPYFQGYNLTVQYEVSANDSFEIGYVASLGRHIETFPGLNNVTTLLPPSENPQNYIPFPEFGRGSPYATTNANSYYHSMQAKWTRRMAKGLDFLGAFTWAKARTNAHDLLSGGGEGGFRAPDIPGFGIQGDYGLAPFDVRRAFVYSGTYQFPVGRGRTYMSTPSLVQNAFLGGWSFNWILTLQDGQPLTIGCQRATAAGAGCYPLLVPGQDLYAGKHDVDQWVNPDAFMDPPVATQIGQTDFAPLGGSATPIIGPGFHRFDWSIFKQFRTTEKTYLEFRAEFFNLTNTPQFGVTGMNRNYLDKANFGKLTTTRDNPYDPRQIQFALKFYF